MAGGPRRARVPAQPRAPRPGAVHVRLLLLLWPRLHGQGHPRLRVTGPGRPAVPHLVGALGHAARGAPQGASRHAHARRHGPALVRGHVHAARAGVHAAAADPRPHQPPRARCAHGRDVARQLRLLRAAAGLRDLPVHRARAVRGGGLHVVPAARARGRAGQRRARLSPAAVPDAAGAVVLRGVRTVQRHGHALPPLHLPGRAARHDPGGAHAGRHVRRGHPPRARPLCHGAAGRSRAAVLRGGLRRHDGRRARHHSAGP